MKNYLDDIVTHSSIKHQKFLMRCQERELTNLLEWIEGVGFTEDLAVLMLGYLQRGLV